MGNDDNSEFGFVLNWNENKYFPIFYEMEILKQLDLKKKSSFWNLFFSFLYLYFMFAKTLRAAGTQYRLEHLDF